MNNPLIGYMQASKPAPNMQEQFTEFMKNPFQFLMMRNINIPQEYASDPKQAFQYLINTGKINNEQLNRLSQMASSMGVRLS